MEAKEAAGTLLKYIKHIRYNLPSARFLLKISALLPGFIIASLSQRLKPLPKNSKNILFILDDQKLYSMGDGDSRYFYMILNRFSEAGYGVYFYKKIDLKTYYRLEVLGRLIFKIKNLKVVTKLPSDTRDIIFAFDRVDHNLLQRQWRKLVYVNTSMPPFCHAGDITWIPYGMFPFIYRTGQHKALGPYREKRRKIKMFFAGNTSKVYYNNAKLKNRYGQLTRIEAIKALLELRDKVKCEEAQKESIELINMKGYLNECHILLTEANFLISPADWLNLISISDFFICLSGTDSPMCHNAIEAMAVGTIPIIGYADWFFPPLKHKHNAIVFSGKDDLIQKVNDVLNMPVEEINRMRKNVIEYYERHLTTQGFIREFEAQSERIFTIMLHPRLVCSKEEEEQGRKLFTDLQSILDGHGHHDMRSGNA